MWRWCVLSLTIGVTLTAADGSDNVPVENVERPDFKQQITKDHVLEELQHQIDTKEKKDMTDSELQFHYFKLHDFDNNNLLDGLEIVKALKHNHDEAKSNDEKLGDSLTSDTDLISIVDGVLEGDDINKDGYVSFHEFMAGQQK